MEKYQVFSVTMSGLTATRTWDSLKTAEYGFNRRKQKKDIYKHIYLIKITWETTNMIMTDGEIMKEWINDKSQHKHE